MCQSDLLFERKITQHATRPLRSSVFFLRSILFYFLVSSLDDSNDAVDANTRILSIAFLLQMASTTKSEVTLADAEKAVQAKQDGTAPFDQHQYQVTLDRCTLPSDLCSPAWEFCS